MIENLGFELTIDNFRESNWLEAINSAQPKIMEFYFSTLRKKALEESDLAKKAVLELLAFVSLPRSAHDLDSPTSNVDGLSPEDIEYLSKIVSEVNDPDLRSRIADILWIRTRDPNSAKIAVSAYLESSKVNEDFEQWPVTVDRIERSFQLASMMGKRNEEYGTVLTRIFDLLEKCNGADPLYLSAELMRLLLERREGDASKYVIFCEKLALKAESQCDFHRARRYWEIQSGWHFQNKNETGARNSRLRIAETYEKESLFIFENRQPKYLMASYPLEQAIAAYRNAGDSNERIEAIKLKLLEFQKAGIDEMPLISSGAVDISELVGRSEKAVSGKSFSDALLTLALLSSPNSFASVRKRVEENREKYVFAKLFPKKLFNSTGRIVGVQPIGGEEAILADMFQYVQTAYQLSTKGFIEPARNILYLEHPLRIHEVVELLINHPLIPAGREIIVGRGLHAGLIGDFLSAIHFLIPQIEESFRHVLIQSGIVPSSFTDNEIQDEFNLNKLLTNSKFTTKLIEVFGEDIIFDFRGLLIERFGANLRNDMAHGLIEHNLFYSYASIYFWWLALRFYLLPVFINRQPEPEAEDLSDC